MFEVYYIMLGDDICWQKHNIVVQLYQRLWKPPLEKKVNEKKKKEGEWEPMWV